MITDIFIRRCPEDFRLVAPNAFFVQLFNLYDDHHIGIHKAIINRIDGYRYDTYANEHIRIIAQTMKKLANEIGRSDLNKPEYKNPDFGYADYRIFKNYVFDESINPFEKLSLFEILFRDSEKHLFDEVRFLEANIPQYTLRSEELHKLSQAKKINYYNDGEESLRKARPQLEQKMHALALLRTGINERLKLHGVPLVYHNGYFQQATDPLIEVHLATPFWLLVSDPTYKNVEIDMLEALDRYDSGGRDPALYAAKAMESLIKILCDKHGFTTGRERGAGDYISHLNSTANGAILINDEKEELLSMFRIRNTQGHGPGGEPMPTLSDAQTRRYIHAAMAWIFSLAAR